MTDNRQRLVRLDHVRLLSARNVGDEKFARHVSNARVKKDGISKEQDVTTGTVVSPFEIFF